MPTQPDQSNNFGENFQQVSKDASGYQSPEAKPDVQPSSPPPFSDFSQDAPPTPSPASPASPPKQSESENIQDTTFPKPPDKPFPEGPQVTPPKTEKSKFKLIILGLLVLTVITWALVASLYFSNKKLREELVDKEIQEGQATPTPTTSEQITYETKLVNGSIYTVSSEGTENLVINKDDYSSTGIAGFMSAKLSPDYTKLCFESWPPALEPALYYSEIDGSNVVKVNDRVKNCTWSNNSDQITYVNDASQDSPVNIYIYKLALEEETNLTKESTSSAVFRRYAIEAFSDDDNYILCDFEEINTSDVGTEKLGNCEIDLSTGEITEIE